MTDARNMRKLMEAAGKWSDDDVSDLKGKMDKRAEFNKDGYRTLFSDLKFTGVEGDRYKVQAVDYDSSVNTMSDVDGVMVGWYNHDRNENVYIHLDDLRRILNEVEGKI